MTTVYLRAPLRPLRRGIAKPMFGEWLVDWPDGTRALAHPGNLLRVYPGGKGPSSRSSGRRTIRA